MIARHLLASTALALSVFSVPKAHAAEHWALVVGINDYETQWPRLSKAVADATGAASILAAPPLKFNVVSLTKPEDTTQAAIRTAWKAMLGKVHNGDVVMFYFAGHGSELDGQNYLIPSDGQLRVTSESTPDYDPEQARNSSLSFQEVLSELAERQKDTDAIGVFIIDACRDNPFQKKSTSAAGEESKGIGPVRPPQQVMVMYSAGIGQRAHDGGNDDANSVYAAFLLPLLEQRDVPLSELAQRIRHSVYLKAKEYEHLQTPAYYDQLRERLTLLGEPGEERDEPVNKTEPYKAGTRGVKVRDVMIECAYCPEMTVLDAGHFLMGAPESEEGSAANERPQHRVDIPRRFAMGKFEITNREWNQCVRDQACEGLRDLKDPRRELLPVTGVSWTAAQNYVKWLSKVTGSTYRLPSEAEWEYAARAGTTSRYSFGDGTDAKIICRYANGADQSAGAVIGINATCNDDFGRGPAPRGSYLPNPWDLQDMHGNVWEWVEDCWHDTYAGSAPANGSAWGPADGQDCAARVARGGSWRSGIAALRSAVRHDFPPGHERATLGFRVVREIAESQ